MRYINLRLTYLLTFARRLKAQLFVSTEWHVPAARLILLKAALFLNIIIIISSNSSSSSSSIKVIRLPPSTSKLFPLCNAQSIWYTSISVWYYLGVFFVTARVFKCSFDHSKCQFFTACNAIFSKVERFASEAVLLILIRTKCLPRCCIVPTGYKRRKVVGVHSYSIAYEIV